MLLESISSIFISFTEPTFLFPMHPDTSPLIAHSKNKSKFASRMYFIWFFVDFKPSTQVKICKNTKYDGLTLLPSYQVSEPFEIYKLTM